MLPSAPKRLLLVWCLSGVLFAAGPPGVWLDVPFIRQPKEGCGAASIAMVMQYWSKREVDVAPIQRALYSPDAHGIQASDLERYLQQHQFQTFAFAGRWEDLKHHLEKGRPLIVALRPAGPAPQLHYVVVAGVDWEEQVVMVNDPAGRKLLKQERAQFEKQWAATHNWTLLAVPQPSTH